MATSKMEDLLKLDWKQDEFPEDFVPLDAIVLVKGYYETDDGSMTRPVWVHRWTVPLARNVYERIGAIEVAKQLMMDEACEDYDDGERDTP